jgi:hypothetical protein
MAEKNRGLTKFGREFRLWPVMMNLGQVNLLVVVVRNDAEGASLE